MAEVRKTDAEVRREMLQEAAAGADGQETPDGRYVKRVKVRNDRIVVKVEKKGK
jgi:hypothetical protein